MEFYIREIQHIGSKRIPQFAPNSLEIQSCRPRFCRSSARTVPAPGPRTGYRQGVAILDAPQAINGLTGSLRERPDAVVFGHTHRPFCGTIDGALFFNPGYAGKTRFGLKRSVAILHCDENGIQGEYLPL